MTEQKKALFTAEQERQVRILIAAVLCYVIVGVFLKLYISGIVYYMYWILPLIGLGYIVYQKYGRST